MTTPLHEAEKTLTDIRSAAPVAVRFWAGTLVVIAWLGLSVMGHAETLDIPELSVMQPDIAVAHPELVQQREVLQKERKALFERTESLNKPCKDVEPDSAADASCDRAYIELGADINRHAQASKQYNGNYRAAANHAARPKPAPITDPMVVDARNVPSGLPKSVEDQIPKTEAGIRVRRGFEAIMAHDWYLAGVFFKDALNHEPGEAGLKRLVDLAEYTLQKRTDDKAQIKAKTATLERIQNEKIDEYLAGALGDFNRNYAPKNPYSSKPKQSSTPLPTPVDQKVSWKPFFDYVFNVPPPRPRAPSVSAPRG